MNNYRFACLFTATLIFNAISACGSPAPTPEPTPTAGSETPISIFNIPGTPLLDLVEPTAAIVSEHDEEIDEAQAELNVLRSLWIGSLPSLPPDPSNAVADDPLAAQLGQQIFFDTRFSANGQVSCATCHKPELMFTDGLPRAEGIGPTARNSMTIVGTAYNLWFFWDGRRDSQWAQSLGPLEDPAEHGGTRTQYVHLIADDPSYRAGYETIFGPLPDVSDRTRFPNSAGPFGDAEEQAAWESMALPDRQIVTQVFANLGKAIAAYERQIIPGPSRFDAYVEAALAGDEEAMATLFSDDEISGMRLFTEICIYCHRGPLFTDNSFWNIGVPNAGGLPLDAGRIKGIEGVLANEFNCLGPYSDAGADDCARLNAIEATNKELRGAFKVPGLRNVAETAPYMHAGQYSTLREVLEHYKRAETGPFDFTELRPMDFSDQELAQLEAFLRTLSGSLTIDQDLLIPPPR